MAIGTGPAIIGGVLLLGLAGWQYSVAADLRQQNATLQHSLADKSASALAASRQSCAERSQRYFTSLGYNEAEAKDGINTTFQNHYSKRLGRCIMTLESTSYSGSHETISKSLIDTDERKTFGEYGWVSSDTKKYYDQKPMQCHETPPDKEEAFCHTTNEYDAYQQEMLSS